VPPTADDRHPATWLAVTLGGAGLAAIGVGVGLALDAHATEGGELAKPVAQRDPSVRDHVHTEGTVSFVTTLAGVALLATVPVVLLTGPRHDTRASLRVGPLGVVAAGTF
jgi:hypothetical protein